MSPSTTDVVAVDPSSAAFKKARRQYIRTTKNRSQDVDANWTPFRAAEKKFKARFPPPDLTDVLDLAAEDRSGGGSGGGRAVCIRTFSDGGKVYTVPAVPGLVLLPSFVSPDGQRTLVQWALRDHARHPNETNLDAHYILPPEGIWNAHVASLSSCPKDPTSLVKTKASAAEGVVSQQNVPSGPRQLISNDAAGTDNIYSLQAIPKPSPEPSTTVSDCSPSELVPKLRWANIGWSYHWGTKQYDFSKGKGHIDSRIRDLCRNAVSLVPWNKVFGADSSLEEGWGDDDWKTWSETYEPDAGIVNFYQTKDTLMAHVDRSEVCATSPLVSISLGNTAIFLIGGLTRDVEPTPILLRSGDVVIMSGPACRRAYHGVPRILENTLPEHFAQSSRPTNDGANASVSQTERASSTTVASAWEPYRTYMQNARININVRQVFPKGFVPGTVNPALRINNT
ncbi:hypothetical protein M404DRAFT_481088 [Pisolithus tinctorius Marx 270]|uniref:Fe2OG dioxygenase domain-containing protein n=1 Tax=Pisolithus tinctorius Marx 270 TaxID=870435 RepID=A0A0C3NZX2_PISTI|nr:hypothetical protein M404DRAFT_481088 [Pisolithus tinctorius Marx 270]